MRRGWLFENADVIVASGVLMLRRLSTGIARSPNATLSERRA
jgi:hypothetical protein